MKIVKLSIITTVLTVIVVLILLLKNNYELFGSQEKGDEMVLNHLEDVQSMKNSDLNFLYFNESHKELNLYFPYQLHVEKADIEKVNLNQNDEIMLQNVTVVSILDNYIKIKMESYIPYFNNIKLTDNIGNSVLLSVGQHYMEKLDTNESNILVDDTWIAREMQTDLLFNEFKGTYSFDQPSKAKLVNEIAPFNKTTNVYSKIEQDHENPHTYRSVIRMPEEAFKLNNSESITVDVAWFQVNDNGDRKLLFIENIPFSKPN